MEKNSAPPPYDMPQQQYAQNMAPNPQYMMPPPQQPPQPQVVPMPMANVTVVNNSGGAVVGGCPVCHAGSFGSEFTCCGILCCILFFPVGILCCLCMRRKRCSNCGFTTGVTGGVCPMCREGRLQTRFTTCGIVLAVVCFPWGIICCLLKRQAYCSYCGYVTNAI